MRVHLPKNFQNAKQTFRFYSSNGSSGYFERRLQELKDQSIPRKGDALAKLGRLGDQESLVDQNEDLKHLHESLPQKTFDKKFVAEIQFSGNGSPTNRLSREIALSKPWTGEESAQDASLRMLVDTVGKPKKPNVSSNLGFVSSADTNQAPRSLRASVRVQKKLEDAQDSIIKYKYYKEKEIEDHEQSQFRRLYTEKFTPIGSFEKIHSVADQRIEEGKRRGSFEGLNKLRGKPLELPKLNQHVDATEHYLNNMLARQKVIPPWIEAQSRVNNDITELRCSLSKSFENAVNSSLQKLNVDKIEYDFYEVCSLIETKFGSVENFASKVFSAWKSSSVLIVEGRIKNLNANLRSYNLQAPLSSQKLYLQADTEFQKALGCVTIRSLIEKMLKEKSEERSSRKKNVTSSSVFSFINIFRY